MVGDIDNPYSLTVMRKMSSTAIPTGPSKRLEAFRASVVRDLYSPDNFVDWDEVERELEGWAAAIQALQRLIDVEAQSEECLAEVIEHEPLTVEVMRRLLAAPQGAAFADGRELSAQVPATREGRASLARLLNEIGIWRLLRPSAHVEDLVRVAAVTSDAERRRLRRLRSVRSRIQNLVQDVLDTLRTEPGLPLELLAPRLLPAPVRRTADIVVSLEGTPIAAIRSVFLSSSGGRQQREFTSTYPRAQRELDTIPAAFVLIADGRGMADLPDAVLENLFDSIAACLTFAQAEDGGLAHVLTEAAENYGRRRDVAIPVDRIIEETLSETGMVVA